MMTVKELSQLTGISARTLHCYNEIGLFAPTKKSEAGYRLYDDKALETLRQMQKQMLTAKKERLEKSENCFRPCSTVCPKT